jgi:parallel beta-helix repeat protein
VVRANGVTVKNVSVVGGDNGVTVENVRGTTLDHVSVAGAKLDGIHVRFASVHIHDCNVDMLGNELGQGIDISFTMGYGMSMVDGCTIVGGMDGITTHVTMSDIARNTVTRTTMRGISMTEMSMGTIEENEVRDALGIGIFCNDQSECDVERNTVVGTRADPAGGPSRGIGFEASFRSVANLKENRLADNPVPSGTDTESEIRFEH